MKALILINVPEDKDIDDLHIDFKLYEGDTCLIREYGAPLAPLPEKKEPNGTYYGWNMMVQGWNECLDEILGEEK